MLVKPVTEQEYDDWLRLRMALYPEITEDGHRLEMQAVLADGEQACCYVAHLEEKAVGFLEVAIRDWAEGCDTKNVGYLESVYVDEFFRRSGVAGGLIQAAEKWARDHGAAEIASDVDINNDEALGMHHHMNYEEVGRSVLFKKKLA